MLPHLGAMVHKQFVSLSLGADKGRTRLNDELSSYCVINDVPKSAFGKVRGAGALSMPSASHTCASTTDRGRPVGSQDVLKKVAGPPGREWTRVRACPCLSVPVRAAACPPLLV